MANSWHMDERIGEFFFSFFFFGKLHMGRALLVVVALVFLDFS